MIFGILKFYSIMFSKCENRLNMQEISDKFFGETLAPANFEETLVSEISLSDLLVTSTDHREFLEILWYVFGIPFNLHKAWEWHSEKDKKTAVKFFQNDFGFPLEV